MAGEWHGDLDPVRSVRDTAAHDVRVGVTTVGFVRVRKTAGKVKRYQAIAYLDGKQVVLETYDTRELADDAWQHAETQQRRRTGGSSVLAGRVLFKDFLVDYLASAVPEPNTRRHYRTVATTHLLP